MDKYPAIKIRMVSAGTQNSAGLLTDAHLECSTQGETQMVVALHSKAPIAKQVAFALTLYLDALGKEAKSRHWVGGELAVGVWVFASIKPMPQPYGLSEDLPLHAGETHYSGNGRSITL